MFNQVKKYNLKNRANLSGFSLIEMLTVIFIISLISGSVLAGYGRGRDQYGVSVTAQKLAADIRRAQNMALTGRQTPVACAKPNCAEGYGISVAAANSYVLFYNKNASTGFGGSSQTMETIVVDKASISPIGSTAYFVPPEPLTFLSGGSPVIFTLSKGSYSKRVTVYQSGRVDIE